jgi:hypothetical protein
LFVGIHPLREGEGTRLGTSVTADEEGHATYRQIVPGSYELQIKMQERGECTVEVEIKPGENTVEVRLK